MFAKISPGLVRRHLRLPDASMLNQYCRPSIIRRLRPARGARKILPRFIVPLSRKQGKQKRLYEGTQGGRLSRIGSLTLAPPLRLPVFSFRSTQRVSQKRHASSTFFARTSRRAGRRRPHSKSTRETRSRLGCDISSGILQTTIAASLVSECFFRDFKNSMTVLRCDSSNAK